MSKVKEYLSEYAKLCLGVESNPKGLDHNTDFQSFVHNPETAGLLIGYEEKTNSFVVNGEGKMDAYFLIWKKEGEIEASNISDSISIVMASDISDLKELVVDQLRNVIQETEPTADSIEYQLLGLVKEDLHSDPQYIDKVRKGNLNTIFTFEDEARIQQNMKTLENTKEADRFISALSLVVSYTDPSKELSGAQIDSSIREIVQCFKDLLQPEKGKHFDHTRALHLIKMYAEKLFHEAHKENSQLDLFDYENCNLRLKLSLWKDILREYQSEIETMASQFNLNVESVFSGPYSEYIKKLTSANYLRGIYDELIRFCKYHNFTECDKKLQAFNELRKEEKMTAKQERDNFFKEFGSYLMNIVEHVDTQILPILDKNPIEALVEVKKWNNILNYRKNTPEVKKIRDAISAKIPKICDHVQASLATIGKSANLGAEFVRKWREAHLDYQNLRGLLNSLLEGGTEEAMMKLNQLQEKFDSLVKKFCSKLEDDLSQMRSQDSQNYEETSFKKAAFFIEDGIYCFLTASTKAEEFSDTLIKIKQNKLDNNYSVKFKKESEDILSLKDTVIHLKQILQNFTFNVEKLDEGLLDIVKSDPTVLELLNCIKNRLNRSQLSLENPETASEFLREVGHKTEDAVNKLKSISQSYKTTLNSLQYLSGFKLYNNQSFWRNKIQEHIGSLLKQVGCKSLSDEKLAEVNTEITTQLKEILSEKVKQSVLDLETNLDKIETQMIFTDNVLSTAKTPEEMRSQWEGNLKDFRQKTGEIISELPSLTEVDKKDIISNLNELWRGLSVIGNNLIEDNVAGVKNYLSQPKDCDFVLGLKDTQTLLSQPGHKALHTLEEILKKLEKIQLSVDSMRDEKKIGSKVTLKLDRFKEDVFRSIVEQKEQIATTIRDNLNEDVQTVDNFILGAQSLLKKKATSITELEELKKEHTVASQKFKELDEEVKGLDKKIKIVNDFGFKHAGQINVANVRRKWDNFSMKFGGFSFVIATAENGIRKKVKGDLEKMTGEIDKFYTRIQALDLGKAGNMNKEQEVVFSNTLKDVRRQWEEIQKVIGDSLASADTYGVDLSDMKSLTAVREYFKGPFAAWMIYFDFLAGIEKMEKEEWVSCKYQIYDFQKYVLEWEEKVKGKSSEPAARFIADQCTIYKDIWPALKSMIGEGFQRSHWTELFALIGLPKSKAFNEVTFGDILSKKEVIHKKIDEIRFLAARAQGEIALREALTDLQDWCETTLFTFSEYNDQEKMVVNLIKEWTDILTEVGDNQVVLQNIKDSKFSANFKDQIEGFESKLGGLDELILKLNQIQRKWVYLEPVFGRGALPSEQGRFRRIDDEFRSVLQQLNKDPQVVTLALIPNISDSLDMLVDQLDRCQKALNSYLEEKRNIFPRFYFLGDDDLLELLGQSQNPAVIHSHLRKLFSGITKLKMNMSNPDRPIIESMLSAKGESVTLIEKVPLTKDVENWLGLLTTTMSSTLEHLLKSCIKDGKLNFEKYPGQVLEIAESVFFCDKAAKAIKGNSLESLKKDNVSKLAEFTSGKAKMDNLGQMKIKNLILDVIHNIAVVDELVASQVRALEDWTWFKQLKYRLDKEGNILVGMGKAEFPYTYEYQGNVSKLVHTPLTDKCYLTLTQGMMMGYGGNPYGPAGTGKTESVKALGYAFGRQVLVFNCDEGIDYQSMGRIFIGLVKCGAWGCFDEFNRLLEDQLSAISQQIQIIQYAIKEGVPKISMLGQETSVSPDAGIFVTMNPAGKGYGGRSKLPDNLKQLFRPVAMSKPDNEMISEFLLFSEGYSTAKKLAKKVVTVFTLSKQLLSPQQHYDWGLRALKTILVVAGQLIQKSFEAGETVGEKKEAELLIKAIRVNTMSKLTFADIKKFENLMANVFMGTTVEDVKYEDLTKAIAETLIDLNFTYVERQVAKIRQFYEAVRQRMGVVLVGPSGCSKTTIWRVLRIALKKLGQEVKVHILNPKSVSRTELLGNMNNETREFVDGILTSLARKVVKEPPEVMSWIICDGDVDPEWIESLNSVLDDNHLLTLPNGERISLGNNINFIFETHDLKFASPATVSRMGMMYLNNEDINIDSIMATSNSR